MGRLQAQSGNRLRGHRNSSPIQTSTKLSYTCSHTAPYIRSALNTGPRTTDRQRLQINQFSSPAKMMLARANPVRSSAAVRSTRKLTITCVARPSGARPVVKAEQAESPASTALMVASAALAPLLLGADAAHAADGAYGLLEGRTVALIHPVWAGHGRGGRARCGTGDVRNV